MVPSLTETLLTANVEVVGRTRYCLYPENKVDSIAVVGGTKDIRWSLVEPLNADLLLLDREENPKRFAEQSPIEYFATHITSVKNVGPELERLAGHLHSEPLLQVSRRWQKIGEKKARAALSLSPDFCAQLPGVIEWWNLPQTSIDEVLYIIWRDPWMAIAEQTFIGSVLQHLGVALLPLSTTPYPKIKLEDYVKPKTLLLFSSEPYNFKNEREELMKFNCASALVDGEKFSWFGVRTLHFLESLQN